VPVRLLYNREPLFGASKVMYAHVPAPYAELNQRDADELGIADGDPVLITVGDLAIEAQAHIDSGAPAGIVLLPQRLSDTPMPLAPAKCAVQKTKE
jgi:anaerobic selenocysteine-containing dehydrogenase